MGNTVSFVNYTDVFVQVQMPDGHEGVEAASLLLLQPGLEPCSPEQLEGGRLLRRHPPCPRIQTCPEEGIARLACVPHFLEMLDQHLLSLYLRKSICLKTRLTHILGGQVISR